MNRKISFVLPDKSSSYKQRGMQPPPFSHEIKLAAHANKMMQYAEFYFIK